ncbi:MAG TPA: methyltransferase domain-containing protein [Polyangiaceae bacterium]|jgi:SAM-dependent methyltransferase|nr:methyltransferase domain-containing protein [Polyangiaceae bacterium]
MRVNGLHELKREIGRSCPTAADLVLGLRQGATVVDVGCHGWLLGESSLVNAVRYLGVDRVEPPNRPRHAEFVRCSAGAIELPDDHCELVVASHVLEHVSDPVGFMTELVRIAKPGGQLWLESPSEPGCQSVGSDDVEDQRFLSFWDDPTHVRPWTPGALYRLALSCEAVPLAIQRGQSGDVAVSKMLALKPPHVNGAPRTRYVTLKNVGYGLRAAYESVWGRR